MPDYDELIQVYFPPPQWQAAMCITAIECPPQSLDYPRCVVDASTGGPIQCTGGQVVEHPKAYGLFGILDACYDPTLNPGSPFTPEQWGQVLEPEMNVWMASVIWSLHGWEAWTTCRICEVCQVEGGDIPYPLGPRAPVQPPSQAMLIAGAIGGIALGAILVAARKGRYAVAGLIVPP